MPISGIISGAPQIVSGAQDLFAGIFGGGAREDQAKRDQYRTYLMNLGVKRFATHKNRHVELESLILESENDPGAVVQAMNERIEHNRSIGRLGDDGSPALHIADYGWIKGRIPAIKSSGVSSGSENIMSRVTQSDAGSYVRGVAGSNAWLLPVLVLVVIFYLFNFAQK